MLAWGVAFLTFAIFVITSLSWGGTALNGKIEDGRFYFGDRGEFREVGRSRYAISAVLSMIWPVALVAGAYRLRLGFPQTSSNKKLFLVLVIFFGLAAFVASGSSLLFLLRAIL
jgi:hypothetical protein